MATCSQLVYLVNYKAANKCYMCVIELIRVSSLLKLQCESVCLLDKGILLTFGGGENGCLGHGDHSEVKEVSHMILM